MFLQAVVNKSWQSSCIIAEYILDMHYEVHDVIKYTQGIASVNSINGEHITDYVTCASSCFCVMK